MKTVVKEVVELERPGVDANGLVSVPSVSGPVLAAFDSVPPPELLALADSGAAGPATKRARVRCFCDTAQGGALDVVAESQTLLFRGSPGAVAQLPRRTAVGIRSRRTGALVLVEVPAVAPLCKRVKAASGERSAAAQAGLDAALSFAERRTLLAATFGTRKKMVQMRSSATNQLPETVADVSSAQHAAAADAVRRAVAAQADAGAADAAALESADMPPFHADAATPDAVYVMEEVFPVSQWVSASTAAQERLAPLLDTTAPDASAAALRRAFAQAAGAPGAYVGGALARVYDGKLHRDDAVRALAVLVCMNQLLGFALLAPAACRDNDALVAAAHKWGLTKTDTFTLAAQYLDAQQSPGGKTTYTRSALKTSKLVNTFLAGALFLEGWHLSNTLCSAIAKDMKVYADRIWSHLLRMGCARRSTQGRVSYELTVPLNAVPESLRQRKRKEKKW